MTGAGSSSAPTLAALLAEARATAVDRLDGQLLLLHALGKAAGDRAWLLANDEQIVGDEVAIRFRALCDRRRSGEPLAYLVGSKEFHGLALQVDARVLVPRPDTETLVEWALECLAPIAEPAVLDLGTGSGAIALAIAKSRPDARVTAVDASEDALAVARANADRLGLQLDLREGDWFAGLPRHFTLVASNPPYIAPGDPHLPALRHEPLTALVAGDDGLRDLRRIVQDAPDHLVEGGWLLLEHGFDQAAAVRSLLEKRGFDEVQSRRDLAGIERASGGIWRTVK
ncbi:N5-glutamine methyltransferase, modifies release factors RF-1 and RF-2 [Burkholderiales bacterium 8X]|nr:N5-glutamine methyltransferase, modifies release factors RF-1 and RF-2 [Burkholderiales bacterium 8X]